MNKKKQQNKKNHGIKSVLKIQLIFLFLGGGKQISIENSTNFSIFWEKKISKKIHITQKKSQKIKKLKIKYKPTTVLY
jgi:hypothetical protein